MGEREIEGGEGPDVIGSEGDRGAVVVSFGAVAVSGFLMGLFVRGEGALGLAVAVLALATLWSGWWLRGALRSGGHPARQ